MPVIDLGSVVGPQGPQGAAGATGAQGIQGNPGPNQVTDQTSTNLNGVLFGNQSRVTVKPVDSTPTADSTNLVSSGGVKTALDTKANQSQLATVETIATASRAYTVGECFTLNGVLYECTYPISAGGTITVNANCKVITVGDNLVGKPSTVGKAYFDHDTGFMGIHLLMKDSTHQLLEVYEDWSTGPVLIFKRFNGSAWEQKWRLPNLKTKTVTLTLEQMGTSFSPTARNVGHCETLFGVSSGNIYSIVARDNALTPASNFIFGFYNNYLYVATTQDCTLSSSVTFNITYNPYS